MEYFIYFIIINYFQSNTGSAGGFHSCYISATEGDIVFYVYQQYRLAGYYTSHCDLTS